MLQRLYTREGHSLPEVPWNHYPRPQLRREDWFCLNGSWEFEFQGKRQSIRVPFCPESLLSEVETAPQIGETMLYRRSFSVPAAWAGKRILLHFGAVSREAEVFVNDRPVGSHQNGYFPFSVDITDALEQEANVLLVRVRNDLSPVWPHGKQSTRRGGMWYTPCSGIWQTVWLEPVPEVHIRSLHIRSGSDWVEIQADGVSEGMVELEGREYPLENGKARICIPDPELWSPEHPHLYSFVLRSGEDRISSYFALRTLTTETVGGIPRLCLNGKPVFFNGLLDQGYWSDGLYTPAAPECFEKDILAMKALGFNTLRKHIKIEPELFYYTCDRLGMLVFQDMVNNGEYHFLRDTVIPTLGLKKLSDGRRNADPETRRVFLESMEETVQLLRNHPCICLWTIFNEGWGQFEADEAYRRLRKLDSTRFIDSTSGWFHRKESDVNSLHCYFGKLRLGKSRKPQLLSEFGGYVWKIPEHSFHTGKTYGYRIFKSREDFVEGLRKLYGEIASLKDRGLCGAVYTQVSDVEEETNGLFTFDREVLKIRPGELKELYVNSME